jgi:hypothetical protein
MVPERSNRFGDVLGWIGGIAATSGGAYWALLGWDTEKDVDPVTGSLTGPYAEWQVVALGTVVVVLAFIAGRAGRAGVVTGVVPTVITASFVITAANDPDAGPLWIVGAALTAIGTLSGVALIALIGARLQKRPRLPQ